MKVVTPTDEELAAREALAEVCASIDGKKDEFIREREIVKSQFATSSIVMNGHYAGYMAEAGEMIDRLRARSFDVTRIRVAKLEVIK